MVAEIRTEAWTMKIIKRVYDGWETVATVVSVVNPYAADVRNILEDMERHANQALAEYELKGEQARPAYVAIGGWMLTFYQDDSEEWCARASIHDCLATDILRKFGKAD
jgi:hypothetical protein